MDTARCPRTRRRLCVAACLWFLAVPASWAADELPIITAASKLHWIWADQVDAKAETVVFEKTFTLEKKPTGGRIRVMANAGCTVTINDEVVGDQTDLKRPKDLPLKGQLAAGENKVRIEAKRGGNSDAVVLSMFVTEADGIRRRLETDGSWQVVPASGKAVAAKSLHSYDKSPWGDVFAVLRPSVTKPDAIKVPDGFQVELLHALDEAEGSWVAMCVDGKGRLIASDAGGRMVRITPPPIGGDLKLMTMEPITLPVGHANGLLWAFDSLYVMVCQEGVYEAGSGVYRVRDTDGDDVFDKVELLRKIHGSGDHGPHALLLSSDGTVITGRLINNDPQKVQIQPNLYVPSDVREFARKDISEMRPSPVSLMAAGLLNTCHSDEVADLIAWIQSGLRATSATPSAPIKGVPMPIAHWKLDDDVEARDSAGTHHGTIHGAVSHDGKFGKALLFDRAKSHHVAIPHSPDFEIGTFTVSAWVWLTKEPTFSGVLGTRSGGEFNFDMKVNADKVHGDIGDGTRWIDTAINFYKDDVGSNGQGGDLETRRWSLITFVVDNEHKECRLYLDADRKKTIPFKGEPRLMRPGQTMTIGNTGAGEFMDGVIDDVRIWKHALVDEQVRNLIAP